MGMYTEGRFDMVLSYDMSIEDIQRYSDGLERSPMRCYEKYSEPYYIHELYKDHQRLFFHCNLKNQCYSLDSFIRFVKPFVIKGNLKHNAFAQTCFQEWWTWVYYTKDKIITEYDPKYILEYSLDIPKIQVEEW